MHTTVTIFLIYFLHCVLPIHGQSNSLSLQTIAGKYYAGDGLGFNHTLTIRPDGTYSFDGHGDLPDQPGNSQHNEGQVELGKDGYLILRKKAEILFFKRTNPSVERLLPVKWGQRLYLVDDQDCSEFCNDINIGLEPRYGSRGMAYLRCGDETKVVSGIPALPVKWQSLILKVPLQGRITKLLAANQCEVNIGQQDGIRKGLCLFAWNKDLSWVKSHPNPNYPNEKGSLAIKAPITWITGLQVVSVNSHSCVAEVDDTNPKYNHLAVGQSVTSR